MIHGVILIDTDDTNIFESDGSKAIQQIINIEPKPAGTTARC